MSNTSKDVPLKTSDPKYIDLLDEDQVLAGQKFASRNDKPYCANCFGELFAKRCTSCSKPITGKLAYYEE